MWGCRVRTLVSGVFFSTSLTLMPHEDKIVQKPSSPLGAALEMLTTIKMSLFNGMLEMFFSYV